MISHSRAKKGPFLICLVLFLFTLFVSCHQEFPEDRKAIIDVVDRFFLGLAARDTTILHSVMLQDGTISSVRETDGQIGVRSTSYQDFFNDIAAEENKFIERMWEPKVLVSGHVAVLWTPYDFHFNGVFSHCGIDAFSLLKTNDGWKIAGTVYSVVKTGCEESPLGPPEFPEANEEQAITP